MFGVISLPFIFSPIIKFCIASNCSNITFLPSAILSISKYVSLFCTFSFKVSSPLYVSATSVNVLYGTFLFHPKKFTIS